MKFFTRSSGLWAPVFITILFLLLLTGLNARISSQELRSVSAFQPHSSTELSDENLVDGLRALPLGLRIGQADWDNGALYLDMRITEEPLSVETLYKDLATILSFSFEDKMNVNRLFLRFEAVDPWSQSRYLILAANARRSEWDHGMLDELSQLRNEPFSERLVQGLHLTLTNLWKKQFIRN